MPGIECPLGEVLAFAVLVALVVLCRDTGGMRRRWGSGQRLGRRDKTDDTIVGAGASFPFPLYSKWGQEYNAESGVKLNYQSIGSGGGISAIKQNTVDFGASDAPLDAGRTRGRAVSCSSRCASAAS